MAKRKITEINLYDLLHIPSTATEQEIKKAYRKKALKVHPDKNPDDSTAASQFLELSEALAVLTDAKAREAYDKTLKAKQLAKERLDVLDVKRRKLRDQLEERERKAKESASASSRSGYCTSKLSDEQRLQNEIDRLRKEGSRILAEEQENIREKIRQTQRQNAAKAQAPPTASSLINEDAQSFADFESMILKQLAAAAEAQKVQQMKETNVSTSQATDS